MLTNVIIADEKFTDERKDDKVLSDDGIIG